MSPYEMIDIAKDELGAEKLAEYLWMNYPMFADDIRHHIEARIYLDAVSMQPDESDLEKGGDE